MNVDTGQIYRGDEEIKAAISRGEPIVEFDSRLANALEQQKHSIRPTVSSQDIARAERNLKRAQPNMSESERRDLAQKVAAV